MTNSGNLYTAIWSLRLFCARFSTSSISGLALNLSCFPVFPVFLLGCSLRFQFFWLRLCRAVISAAKGCWVENPEKSCKSCRKRLFWAENGQKWGLMAYFRQKDEPQRAAETHREMAVRVESVQSVKSVARLFGCPIQSRNEPQRAAEAHREWVLDTPLSPIRVIRVIRSLAVPAVLSPIRVHPCSSVVGCSAVPAVRSDAPNRQHQPDFCTSPLPGACGTLAGV